MRKEGNSTLRKSKRTYLMSIIDYFYSDYFYYFYFYFYDCYYYNCLSLSLRSKLPRINYTLLNRTFITLFYFIDKQLCHCLLKRCRCCRCHA